MQHLNYCRQLAKQCKEFLAISGIDGGIKELAVKVIELYTSSTKFLLPVGGRLFDDRQYRALDETVPINLPYPRIALEYQSNEHQRAPGEPICWQDGAPIYEDDSSIAAPKRVLFAEESGDWIVITIAFWAKSDGDWRLLPQCFIPRTYYLDRTLEVLGRAAIKVGLANERFPLSDYTDEVGALLCFLNVLQCSNVNIERSEPRKPGKKVKAALPFDTYHILTIDSTSGGVGGAATGGHRSPREHLRRGHIRRLADGRRIWVNAAVVGAGRGAGVVIKDYALRC